eukprot:scaffold182589_cov35-Tisochrysis_lutea.AAC.3
MASESKRMESMESAPWQWGKAQSIEGRRCKRQVLRSGEEGVWVPRARKEGGIFLKACHLGVRSVAFRDQLHTAMANGYLV